MVANTQFFMNVLAGVALLSATAFSAEERFLRNYLESDALKGISARAVTTSSTGYSVVGLRGKEALLLQLDRSGKLKAMDRLTSSLDTQTPTFLFPRSDGKHLVLGTSRIGGETTPWVREMDKNGKTLYAKDLAGDLNGAFTPSWIRFAAPDRDGGAWVGGTAAPRVGRTDAGWIARVDTGGRVAESIAFRMPARNFKLEVASISVQPRAVSFVFNAVQVFPGTNTEDTPRRTRVYFGRVPLPLTGGLVTLEEATPLTAERIPSKVSISVTAQNADMLASIESAETRYSPMGVPLDIPWTRSRLVRITPEGRVTLGSYLGGEENTLVFSMIETRNQEVVVTGFQTSFDTRIHGHAWATRASSSLRPVRSRIFSIHESAMIALGSGVAESEDRDLAFAGTWTTERAWSDRYELPENTRRPFLGRLDPDLEFNEP